MPHWVRSHVECTTAAAHDVRGVIWTFDPWDPNEPLMIALYFYLGLEFLFEALALLVGGPAIPAQLEELGLGLLLQGLAFSLLLWHHTNISTIGCLLFT